MSTARLLGRITEATGAIEELTGSDVRTLVGLATTDAPTFAGLTIVSGDIVGTGDSAIDTGLNRIFNGGLDVWNATPYPYGWISCQSSGWDDTGEAGYLAQESTIIDSPPYSAKLGDGATTYRGMRQKSTAQFRVAPGASYILRMLVAGGDATSRMAVGFRALDSAGTPITTGTPLGVSWTYQANLAAFTYFSSSGGLGTTMTLFVKKITLDSTVYYLRMKVLYYTGGSSSKYVYVDSISLTRGTIGTAFTYKPLFDTFDQELSGSLLVHGNITTDYIVQLAGAFDGGSTDPAHTNRVNLDGHLYVYNFSSISDAIIGGNLSVTGAQLKAVNGSKTTPSYSFTGDLDTGLYYDGTGMSWALGGSRFLQMNSLGQLIINADAITGFDIASWIHICSGGGDGGTLSFQTSNQHWKIYGSGGSWSSAFVLRDETANAERFRVSTGGNFGIGTTGAAAKLAINGGLNVGADSDPGDDNLYVVGNCSALSFTDRTPAFVGEAMKAIMEIKSVDGEIAHDTLPEFCRATYRDPIYESVDVEIEGEVVKEARSNRYVERPGRNLGNTVTLLLKALQEQYVEMKKMKESIAMGGKN
jgi:hypothetical protein